MHRSSELANVHIHYAGILFLLTVWAVAAVERSSHYTDPGLSIFDCSFHDPSAGNYLRAHHAASAIRSQLSGGTGARFDGIFGPARGQHSPPASSNSASGGSLQRAALVAVSVLLR